MSVHHISSPSDIILFVKAGADGHRYGACPFCQRIFMILMIKAQLIENVRFKVITVNISKPPFDFRHHSLRRVAALIHEDFASDNIDDVILYLDDVYPTPQLNYDDAEADLVFNDFFQKFCFYIKEVSKDSTHLLNELIKLNSYFSSRKSKFICGDTITNIDCEVLPKLHHIRIASRYFKDFVIPSNLEFLWKYLEQAYQWEPFRQTCPSDQEVILHWADKPETPNLSMEQHAHLTNEEPKFSFFIPE